MRSQLFDHAPTKDSRARLSRLLRGRRGGAIAGARFSIGEMVPQKFVNKAISAAYPLEQSALGAVAKEAAVIPGGIAKQTEGEAKGNAHIRYSALEAVESQSYHAEGGKKEGEECC